MTQPERHPPPRPNAGRGWVVPPNPATPGQGSGLARGLEGREGGKDQPWGGPGQCRNAPLGHPCASLKGFALSAGPDVGLATLGGQTQSLEGGC